jgi:hypothetical protein
MPSSGTWRCVDPGLTDVSEERMASIFRVEKSGSILHSHRCENLKSYKIEYRLS